MANPQIDTIQLMPGAGGGDAGFGILPYVTLDQDIFAIDPALPAAAFISARDALPAQGGKLLVGPTSAIHKFNASVDFGTKPVEIEFTEGSRFGLADNVPECFIFRRRTRLIRPHWEDDITAAGSGRCFFRFVETVASVLKSCQILHPIFNLRQGADNIARFDCIKYTGTDAQNPGAGLLIDHPEVIVRAGVRQTWSWIGEETSGAGTNEISGDHYGVGLLHAINCHHLRAKGMSFRGDVYGAAAQVIGPLMILEDCTEGIVEIDALSHLDLYSTNSGHAAFVTRRKLAAEAGHQTFCGRRIEVSGMKYFLAMDNPFFVTIEGFDFGRIVSIGGFTSGLVSILKNINNGSLVICRNMSTHNCSEPAAGWFANLNGLGNLVLQGRAHVDRNSNFDPVVHPNCKNVLSDLPLMEVKD